MPSTGRSRGVGARAEDSRQRAAGDRAVLGQAGREERVVGQGGVQRVQRLPQRVAHGRRVVDEVGTLTSKDAGTTPVPGMIGQARHFAGKQGIFGGDKIPNYPAGASAHSTEAWFRAERPNATIIGWGNEGGGRGSKVRMQFRSPPHVHIDSDFSDVRGDGTLPLRRVGSRRAHLRPAGTGGSTSTASSTAQAKPLLDIKSPARLWIGGWYQQLRLRRRHRRGARSRTSPVRPTGCGWNTRTRSRCKRWSGRWCSRATSSRVSPTQVTVSGRQERHRSPRRRAGRRRCTGF